MKFGLIGLLLIGTVNAHQPTMDECPFYASAAQAVAEARNNNIPAEDVLHGMLAAIQDCSKDPKCPVKDGEDSKRIVDFIKQVYTLDIPEGKQIDGDALFVDILHQCAAASSGSKLPSHDKDKLES